MSVVIHHIDKPEQKLLTYAVMDNQSNACFVTDDLLNRLNTHKETSVNLELTTMLEKRIIGSHIINGLVVKGLDQDMEVKLPATYSRNDIPASKSLIPRPETVLKWNHLKDVAEELHPINESADIGLLIGFNCSVALLPRQIVSAGDTEPYAVKTVIGWGVCGNMSV